MAVSYKKLWKLLIDRDMKKKDLAQLAGISNFTISKMSAGNNVTVEVLGKICKALNCTLDDIIATDSWDNPIALSVVQQQTFVFRREWNNMYIEVRFSGQTPPGPTPLSPAVLLAIRSKPRPKCMY